LDAATGATTWSTAITPAGADGGTPAIDAAGHLYIGTDTGVMDAYSSSGTLLWSDKLNTVGAFDPALDGTTLYTADSGSASLNAYSTATGATLASYPLNDGGGPPAIIANGTIYQGDNGVTELTLP
jgi:putative pyrroloquinoline-quinone binding quinoprotein